MGTVFNVMVAGWMGHRFGTQFDLDKLERIPIIFYIHSELLVTHGWMMNLE